MSGTYYVLGILSLSFFLMSCSSDVKKHVDLSTKFSYEEKQYFKECTFFKKKTSKWDVDTLTYSIGKNLNKSQAKFIVNTVEYISTLENLPKFELVDKNANMFIFMSGSEDEFDSSTKVKEKWRGFTANKLGFFKGELISSKIVLRPNLSDLYFRVTFQHELLHALGLSGHPRSKFSFSSALGDRYFRELDPEISSRIPEIDAKALRLLYNKLIPCKVTEAYVSELLGII